MIRYEKEGDAVLKLAPGQTLLGKLELTYFDLLESNALESLMDMRYENVVTVTVWPAGHSDQHVEGRVTVGVLDCTCPFCGTKQKALHEHWVGCCDWNEKRLVADPSEVLDALCDLKHAFDSKYLAEGDERLGRIRQYHFSNYLNFGNGGWAEHLGIAKPEEGFPYFFPGSSPIKLYQFYVENGLQELLRKQEEDPEGFRNVEVLSDGRVVMGWQGPYQGLYECFTPNCHNEFFYLADEAGRAASGLGKFILGEHVPNVIEASVALSHNRLNLTLEDPHTCSLRHYLWDFEDGSFTVNGMQLTSARETRKALSIVDGQNLFTHNMMNPFSDLVDSLRDLHPDIAASYKACMSARYIDPELTVENLAVTLHGMIATLAIANRFRGYPASFYTSMMPFCLESVWSKCLAGQMLPIEFSELEESVGSILCNLSIPNTIPIRKICLNDPTIIIDLFSWGRFPFHEPEHVETFLASDYGPMWLSACAYPNRNLRESKFKMIFKSYLEELVEQKGEDTASEIIFPILNDYSQCQKFMHRGRFVEAD